VRIATEDIRTLEPSAEIRCVEQKFDYVDVIGFSSKPDIVAHSKVLWCVTKSTTQQDLSWYGVPFDRSAKVAEVSSEHRDWVVLTDSRQVADTVANRCVLVPNVAKFLERLHHHHHVIAVVAPVVLGVTGSVGKTTCVALFEDVFSQHGKTLRIYAKRITPLSLFEMVINQLEVEHRYIVMEYAMFHTWHIAELTRLLKPTVGVLLNVSTEHLGIGGIRDSRDILIAKKMLLERAVHAFIEQEIACRFDEDVQGIPGRLARLRSAVRLSHRTIYQIAIAVCSDRSGTVGEESVDRPGDSSRRRRDKQVRAQGKSVTKDSVQTPSDFFDGEVTAPARLKAMGDTMYSAQALAVHAVSDRDEYFELDVTLQEDFLRSALRQFNDPRIASCG
jgi:hypothetical protein